MAIMFSGDEECDDEITSDPANIDGHSDECEAAARALGEANRSGDKARIERARRDAERAFDGCPVCEPRW